MTDLNLKNGFSNIRKYKIYDTQNTIIGRPIDFSFDNSYIAQKFVLGGSRFEEFREKIGLKEDNDPIVPISLLKKIDKNGSIGINVSGEELKNKLHKEAFEDNELLFSQIQKYKIVCNDGERLGHIDDAIFHDDNSIDFVVGEGSVQEFLEKIGIMDDYDLLLPVRYISSIDKTKKIITINKSKEELEIILDHKPIAQIDPTKQYGRINLVHKYPKSEDNMRYKTP